MRAGLTITALLLACAAPAAQAKVRLVEAGIVCPEVREGERRPEPDTESGFIETIEEEVVFDLPDRRVPLMRDLSFGFRVALKDGEPATALTIVVEHPPFGARSVSRESWTHLVEPGGTSTNIFSFDERYEMVEGRWRFAVELEGERVVDVPFDVGAPGAAERVNAVCLTALNS